MMEVFPTRSGECLGTTTNLDVAMAILDKDGRDGYIMEGCWCHARKEKGKWIITSDSFCPRCCSDDCCC
jgi:hypothetical protein